ncbi:MAG: hypothetical protein M3R69_07445 [Acidobacteriota bacterium]|nr:hypothetical protein [Acidobacteriota bacterium]
MKNVNKINFGLSIKVCALLFAAFLLVANLPVLAQHDMSNMPGMSKPKAKSKPQGTSRKKRKPTRKNKTAKKHDMSNMPGMNMPGMNMSGMHRRKTGSRRKKASARKNSANINQMGNMSGMNMPTQSSSPKQSAAPHAPQQMQMNMPGMQMPATSPSPGAQPSASPQMNMNMPGMQMPSASPNPQASPQPKMDMNMPMPSASPSASPMGQMPGMDMGGMNMNMGPLMVMMGNDMGIRVGSSDTNIMSMGAMGSGTTWQPSSGPMHMHYKVAGDWLLLFHYNVIVGMNKQGGPRGVTKLDSQNWFMPMAYHKLGKGTVQLRGMFSFEPFTFPPGGSPLLFQTGETYKGQPIIDKQHPHDLFMELSAQYSLPLGEHGTWFTYFGYPGEPALGPVAFMHRMSASENPSATLAHHEQDSTHISFGVLTTGFTYRWLKLEGSIFNGREPNENRYNFDAHKWNSRSARISIMPNANWTMQASYGFLRSPEAQEANADIRRATASVQYNRPINRGNWASALVWGRNHVTALGEIHNLNGYTAESTLNFLDKNYAYTRLELVDKDDLLRPADRALLGIKTDHPSFRIGAYTFGGVRDIWNTDKVSLGIGSDVTFYSKPAILDRIYGANPVSWKLFFRIRPGKMDMSSMQSTHGNMNSGAENPPTKP